MKTILLLGFFFLNNVAQTKSTVVYVCASKNAKKYHFTSNCRGLSNCQYKILKTTLAIAKSKGKTLCGWEN
jgi:5-bromo-4-chloroindolyl phosphate hydrolysis protein